jgi:hypothetical protein
MKINIKTFFVLLTILCVFPLFVFSQSKSISKETFESAQMKAEENTSKKIRTEISTETSYKDGTVTSTTNSTKQYLPPNQSRNLWIKKKGNIVEKNEEIIIGDFVYENQNDGDWTKRNIIGNGEFMGVATKVGKTESVGKYRLEEIDEGGNKFQVYKLSRTDSLGAVSAFYENEYWIKDGLIYKKILKTSFVKRDNVISTLVETTDYNQKEFKIEAPIIKTEVKQKPL